MYCKKCGKELGEDVRFCPACGEEQYKDATTFDDPFTATAAPVDAPKPAKCWSVFAKVGKILGIVAVCLCWLPLYGIIPGIPGIVFSCLGKKAIDDEAIENRTKGLKLSIIGTVISFVVYFVWIGIAIALGFSMSGDFVEIMEEIFSSFAML